MPYVIGLTGNIGTGKSAVLTHLAHLGARVVDADQVTHEVMLPGGRVYDAVVAAFGSGIVGCDGHIDRARLGAIVFADSHALKRLEAIVHPAVFALIQAEVAAAKGSVVVIEAVKLLESGLTQSLCNQVWVVTAKPEVALARLQAQRGMSEGEARRRLANQMPEAEKMARADVVIDNSRSLGEMQRQVETAWQGLMESLARGRST